jgi:hypothetical protein
LLEHLQLVVSLQVRTKEEMKNITKGRTMSKNRIEIETAENGYTVKCWDYEEKEEKSEFGYVEPVIHVATNDEELLKIVKANL